MQPECRTGTRLINPSPGNARPRRDRRVGHWGSPGANENPLTMIKEANIHRGRLPALTERFLLESGRNNFGKGRKEKNNCASETRPNKEELKFVTRNLYGTRGVRMLNASGMYYVSGVGLIRDRSSQGAPVLPTCRRYPTVDMTTREQSTPETTC